MYPGYENSVQPNMYEKNNPNEYSSYDNYQLAEYGKASAPSYNDGYAKNFNNMDNRYSEYPTEEYKYECRTGPLEGFFVSSVELCKKVKFDDKDRKDDRNGTQGPKGDTGDTGPQGPAGSSVNIFQCGPDTNKAGANVTDIRLCQAPNDANQCPALTDLEGVYLCYQSNHRLYYKSSRYINWNKPSSSMS